MKSYQLSILMFFTGVFISLGSFGQCFEYDGELVNCLNNQGKRVGLWVLLDSDSIKYKEIKYSSLGEVSSVKLFTSNGEELKNYVDYAEIDALNKMKEKIKSNFNWSNVISREGKGEITISVLVNSNGVIDDVRVLRGIHQSFDEEVKRCAYLLQSDIVWICSNDDTPKLIFLPIKFIKNSN